MNHNTNGCEMDIEKLLNDKDFMDRVAARFIKEREDRFNRNNAFRYSPTFDNMVAAINAKGGRIDSEGYGYFPEREKASAGWELFNDAEIREMFDLCSDPESEFVDPHSLCWDMECPFPACVYTVGGLRISWITGQGTSIMIHGENNV